MRNEELGVSVLTALTVGQPSGDCRVTVGKGSKTIARRKRSDGKGTARSEGGTREKAADGEGDGAASGND